MSLVIINHGTVVVNTVTVQDVVGCPGLNIKYKKRRRFFLVLSLEI